MTQILLHQKFAWTKRKLIKVIQSSVTDTADILDANPVRFQLKKKKN